MAWNPSPKVADCREIARKWGHQQVIVIALNADACLPPGCVCDPKTWLRAVPPVCDRFKPHSTDAERCVNCFHDKACHNMAQCSELSAAEAARRAPGGAEGAD